MPGKTFTERLNTAFTEKGEKKAVFAAEVKVSRASVTDWLNGDIKEFKADTLLRVAKYLDVRPEWLQWGEEPKRRNTMQPGEAELLALYRLCDEDTQRWLIQTAKLGRTGSFTGDPAHRSEAQQKMVAKTKLAVHEKPPKYAR